MPEKQERLIGLDIFRGLAIAAMVLVNNPGSWDYVFGPMDHAAWHGWTPTDLVFPFFLFIVGVATPLSFAARDFRHPKKAYGRALWRGAVIFALGLFLNSFNDLVKLDFSALWDHVRIMGVLQRIAIVYVLAAFIYLHFSWRRILSLSIFLLLAYWFIMTWISVPGCAVTSLDDKACNLAAYVDRLVLGNHIWAGGGKLYDPEGLISTLPALVTCLLGLLVGMRLGTRNMDRRDRLLSIFSLGILLFALGSFWGYFFPINKALWTSSYVLMTGGISFLTLAFFIYTADLKTYKRIYAPLIVFGRNPLILFVGSGIVARIMNLIKINPDQNLKQWIFDQVLSPVFGPYIASLAFAVLFLGLWLALCWWLYSRKIFWKV